MTPRTIVTALIAGFLVAGCTHKITGVPATIPKKVVIETVETDADRLLDYYSYMSELQGDPLLREYNRVQRLFEEEPNDRNRMQLIMLMSSQSATFRDTNAAKVLLEIWMGDQYNNYSKLRPLAQLFDNYLTEVRRLDDAIARQASMLSKTSERAARQKKALGAEKERTAALQNKLDALLEMEMNLIEREQITTPDTQ